MDEEKPTPEEETPPEEAAPTLAEAVTAEPVEEAPTPEEAPEPEPAVEEQPVVPQYSEAQVRSLIGAALKNASTNREKTEFEGKIEAMKAATQMNVAFFMRLIGEILNWIVF